VNSFGSSLPLALTHTEDHHSQLRLAEVTMLQAIAHASDSHQDFLARNSTAVLAAAKNDGRVHLLLAAVRINRCCFANRKVTDSHC
jgi:hypothetical protein